MNNNNNEVTALVKVSLADLHMSRSPDEIMAVGDGHRRRRRLSGLVVTTVAAIAAFSAVAAVLALTAVHPSRAPTAHGRTDTRTTVEIRQIGFTLRINSDGSVKFSANDLVDPAAATAALNNAGIAGRVVVHRDACAPVNWNDVAVIPPFPRPTATPIDRPGIMGDETVNLRSSDYPQGGGLLVVIVVRQYPAGTWAHVSWLGYSDVNKIPTCVQLHDPGTGADPNPGG